MTDLPQAALDVAVDAIRTYRQAQRPFQQTASGMATAALEAAAPLIAAAERERCRSIAEREAAKCAGTIAGNALYDLADLLTDPEGTTT
jgi:pyridoxine 5'-phosphate synthase PdxJ